MTAALIDTEEVNKQDEQDKGLDKIKDDLTSSSRVADRKTPLPIPPHNNRKSSLASLTYTTHPAHTMDPGHYCPMGSYRPRE